MLRWYLLQNLYNLLMKRPLPRQSTAVLFQISAVWIQQSSAGGDTRGPFRNFLVHNGLQKQLFAQLVKLLQQKGLLLKKVTMVDSTS
jgi:IS5 family transposase